MPLSAKERLKLALDARKYLGIYLTFQQPDVRQLATDADGTAFQFLGAAIRELEKLLAAERARLDIPPVIHVDNSSADGAAVDRAQQEMREWKDRGFAVAPVPADGHEHPYGQTCRVCTDKARQG